jgi:flagellar L-ring protein FlgH
MKRCLLALLACIPLLVPSPAWADSLWERRTPQAGYLFVDTRARLVGDLLTVIVNENTGVDNRDKREMNKASNAGGVFNFAGETSAGSLSRSASVDFDAQGSATRGFKGESEYSSGQRLLDRMTLAVVGVYPNGNLAVEGFRQRLVSREVRTLRLTGIVRPQDIGPGNTIQSQFIANLHLTYGGDGPQSRFTNQNWLSRFINVLWPF